LLEKLQKVLIKEGIVKESHFLSPRGAPNGS